MARILVCDDESAARRGVVRALAGAGHELVECEDGRQCLEQLAGSPFDLVLLDLRMPVMDGRAALERIVRLQAPPPVVVLTADASVATAIEAVRSGAADYLAKPYEVEELRFVVERTLATVRLREENRRLNQELAALRGGGPLLGESPAMLAVMEAVERVAPTSASVLVSGETGTGKELLARRIHQLGPRPDGPFVALNCAAIPENLVESELFGHRRGAFTGADRDRPGRLREADGGTLLLDEVGDMPLAVQAKLLRVLQDGVVEPLGGGPPARVSVRVIAATHRDLRAAVAAGGFREDLLFRLRVVEIAVPPLRERGRDVLLLAEHFLRQISPRSLRLAADAEAALEAYPWPGNVRELRNAVERAAIFCRGGVVSASDLPAEVVAAVATGPAVEASLPAAESLSAGKARVVERFERAALESALREHAGNLSAAARALGLHRQSLQQKLRRLGIDPRRVRA